MEFEFEPCANIEEPNNSSTELSGFDLEFIQLFNFSSMPDADQRNSQSSSVDQLGVEDYDFACPNDGVLAWEQNEVCFESQLSALDQLIDCDDYSSLFLN